jgi:hypothetical protein
MESLAYLVVIILMTFILAGPIALLLTLAKPKNKVLKIIKRIFQGIVLLLMFVASLDFLFKLFWALGVYGFAMIYLTLAREYFPKKHILRELIKTLQQSNKP